MSPRFLVVAVTLWITACGGDDAMPPDAANIDARAATDGGPSPTDGGPSPTDGGPPAEDGSVPPIDGGPRPDDGGSMIADGGFDSGVPCVPTPETCNGDDDDCDGITDEGDPTEVGCAADQHCIVGSCRCMFMAASTGECITVVRVEAGWYHACALFSDGTARCWGDNSDGQIGDGTLTDRRRPLAVSGVTDATAIALGESHTCVVHGSGGVSCWGRNDEAQVGDGTTALRVSRPSAVVGLSTATAVTAAPLHTCALLAAGTVSCWGYNGGGQLGDGTTTDRPTPVSVIGLSGVAEVAAGSGHTCARLTTGTVSCWGRNDEGQLGDGTAMDRPTPAPVVSLTSATQLSAGEDSACVVLADATVQCWGAWWSSLGSVRMPETIAGATNTAMVGAGRTHVCSAQVDGTARCWGTNSQGELGDGTTTYHLDARPVTGITRTDWITAAYGFSCATTDDSRGVLCWGGNSQGQLGDGTTTRRSTAAPVVW